MPAHEDLHDFARARDLLRGGDSSGARQVWEKLDTLRGASWAVAQEARAGLWMLGGPPSTRSIRARRLLERGLPEPERTAARLTLVDEQARIGDSAALNAALAPLLTTAPGEVAELMETHPRTVRRLSPEARRKLASAALDADRPARARRFLDTASHVPEDVFLRGRVLFAERSFQAALRDFETVRSEFPEADLWIGRLQNRQGQTTEGSTALRRWASLDPSTPKAQEILWGEAMEAERAGNCIEAQRRFTSLASTRGRRSAWASVRAAHCDVRAGSWNRVRETLTPLATSGVRSVDAYRLFWLGRAMQETGDSAGGSTILHRVVHDLPWEFHGHLARRLLGIDDSVLRSFRSPGDSLSDSWALPLRGGEDLALLATDSVSLERVALARTLELHRVAVAELDRLDRSVASSRPRQALVIARLRSMGMPLEASLQARRLLGRLGRTEMAAASPALLRLFWPLPFRDEVKEELGPHPRIDVLFVHALMRQESGFHPTIRSVVGATGLMQIMPATARALARRTGRRDFTLRDLEDPRINIALGVAYLVELDRVWSGNPALVLASYNAGPEPTRRWKPAFDSLPLELAVEEITFWETRDYVRKVLGNLWTYQILWGAK